MKVIVISGFLGAGKTTFIQNMIKRTGKTFCVLENEYAGSTVDKTEIEREDNVNVWELTEGCICCTMKNSFSNKIMNILSLFSPDYLIVEATGMGYLSKIVENIKAIEHENLRMLRTITIVDATSLENLIIQDTTLYEDQIKNGQVIVLSKSEHMSSQEIENAEHYLKSLNPKAEIVTSHYSKCDDLWWNSLLNVYYDGQIIKSEEIENRWEELTLKDVHMDNLTDIFLLMQDLSNKKLGEIIRVKGFVHAGECWIKCDISSERYSLKFVESQDRSDIVFIGKNIDKEGIKKRFIHKIQHIPFEYASKNIKLKQNKFTKIRVV